MRLTESIAEPAALEWFGELACALGDLALPSVLPASRRALTQNQLAGFVPGSPISLAIPVHQIAECAEVPVDEKGLPITAYCGLLRLTFHESY
ncbi:MAG: hypothetical protein EBS01_14980 [Verrucomicrobia bacterium]|nr:hypothetical protein [Verrucomicrobiota bacterium]